MTPPARAGGRPAENRYREDLLALVDDQRDWARALPEVLGPFDVAGHVTADAARELAPGLSGALVAPGTGDNMAAALGLGLRVGEVVVSLGTSGTVYAVSEVPVADATGCVGSFADATGRHLPLACTLNATKVTDTLARVLSLGREAFEAAALAAPAGAGGIVLVPYLDGERTPNRPDATGTLVGLRSDVEPGAIARAAFEGVVCGLLEALDALTATGVDATGRLWLVGGGARSLAYQRVVVDSRAATGDRAPQRRARGRRSVRPGGGGPAQAFARRDRAGVASSRGVHHRAGSRGRRRRHPGRLCPRPKRVRPSLALDASQVGHRALRGEEAHDLADQRGAEHGLGHERIASGGHGHRLEPLAGQRQPRR